jgi:pyruvate formate lyase activating enzyme
MLYQLYQPGDVDVVLAKKCLDAVGLGFETTVPMLPYGSGNRIGYETRRLYFALALTGQSTFNRQCMLRAGSVHSDRPELPVTRIVSFGECNVACPYCKRDCQFVGDDGKPIVAVSIPVIDLFRMAEGAVARGEIVRFSGGDPVKFPRETLAVSMYLWARYGVKTSIAHNGSGPAWVRKMLPFLSSAAIDLKAVPEKIGGIMGVDQARGRMMYRLTLETQAIISAARGPLLDVRTPVFGNTPISEMRRLGREIMRLDPEFTFWTWRMYKPVEGCDWSPPEKAHMFEMMAEVSVMMPDHWIGMRAKWDRGGMVYFRQGRCVNTEEANSIDASEYIGSGNCLNVVSIGV